MTQDGKSKGRIDGLGSNLQMKDSTSDTFEICALRCFCKVQNRMSWFLNVVKWSCVMCLNQIGDGYRMKTGNLQSSHLKIRIFFAPRYALFRMLTRVRQINVI